MRWLPVVWFVGWMVTWPAALADFQSIGDRAFAASRYFDDLGFAMIWSAAPTNWLVAPFVTGFYKHGFQIFPPKINEESR